MNKIARNSIILVAVITVLGAGIWWVLQADPQGAQEPRQEEPALQTVYQIEEAQITAVEIEAEDSLMRFFTQDGQWTLEGYAPEQISQFKVKSLLSVVAQIEALSAVSDAPEACGLDAPSVMVKIERTDGNVDLVEIGDMSPVLGAYFFRVNGGAVYTMYTHKVDDLLNPAAFYTNFSRLDLQDLQIQAVQIEREGKRTIQLRQKEQADILQGMTAWEITAPFGRTYDADDSYVQEQILQKLQTLDISTPAGSADTGIQSPKAVITVSALDGEEAVEVVLKVGNTAGDSTYVAYGDGVYAVPAQSLAFVDIDETLLVFKLLALVPVQTLHTLTLACGDEAHVFTVAHSAIGTDGDQLSFQIDGTPANEQKAKEAYRQVIGIEAAGEYSGAPLGEAIAELVFTSQDAVKTVTFRDIDALYASFTIDGVTEFVVKKQAVLDMVDQIRAFAENPQ